ncbi:amidohydrolase family protein [Nocardia carnea]|uniref:amidohydrolase family protein n=1 Tax=Nocardia carnea TaxID=37328 RepID=UPI002454AB42|nr:amidohydrolase family protein [Nocardia carnea]
MLIRNATVFGSVHTDVRWDDDRITECGTALRPLPGEDDIDARGGWLLPGFHDHHIHLRALAAQQVSVPAGPPHVHTAEEFAAALRRADSHLPPGRWLRAVGYHESVAGALDRWVLDHLVLDRPIRVQHRTGALWILNSAACRAVGLDDCLLDGVEREAAGPTGRLWRLDSWLGNRVPATPSDLGAISAAAAEAGITGYTDATPDRTQAEIDDFAQLVANHTIRQRLRCMAPPGITTPAVGRFTLGPTKFLLDDTTLPDPGHFADRIRASHAEGRPVAVHCVTRVQLVLTMAALDTAGVAPGDRIEHGALIAPDIMAWLRDRGVTVVTQPHFPVERARQYAAEIPPEDRPDLWRLGSLLAAGVPLAAGTDAPFGDPDPWRVVRAAAGPRPGSDSTEELSLVRAISLFLGRPDHPAVARTVSPGSAADLVLLRVAPAEIDLPDRSLVAATIVAGEPVHYTGT